MRKDEPSKKHAGKVEKDRNLGRSDTYAKPTPNFKKRHPPDNLYSYVEESFKAYTVQRE